MDWVRFGPYGGGARSLLFDRKLQGSDHFSGSQRADHSTLRALHPGAIAIALRIHALPTLTSSYLFSPSFSQGCLVRYFLWGYDNLTVPGVGSYLRLLVDLCVELNVSLPADVALDLPMKMLPLWPDATSVSRADASPPPAPSSCSWDCAQ